MPAQKYGNYGYPPSAPANLYSSPVPEAPATHTASINEGSATVNSPSTVELLTPLDERQIIKQNSIAGAQDLIKDSKNNESIFESAINSSIGSHNSQADIVPSMPEVMPPWQLSQHDVNAILSAVEKPASIIMDAACRITDSITQLIEDSKEKRRDKTNYSGIYHFRQWWELTEVTICAGGKLVSGIPIFVKDDVLRVVNNDHSYFIPLDKVDYIRSDDGLCTGTDSPKEQPV